MAHPKCPALPLTPRVMESAICKLTSEEEIALRRIANQSVSVDPRLAHRLVQLQLAEPLQKGWRLTPLGRRQYQQLAQPLLRQRSLAYIDILLDRAIPLARAAGIPQPDPVPEWTEKHCNASAENGVDAAARAHALVTKAAKSKLRPESSNALSHHPYRQIQIKVPDGDAVARSRDALNRSWVLLARTTPMVRSIQ